MSRSRRPVAWTTLAFAAAGILGLSACASPASGDAGSGDQELTVLLISSHGGASKWLKEEYEKTTGVTINPVIVPYDEIGAKLSLDQQSGANTIDVAAPWYVSIGDLAADGSIQDLSDWIESDEEIDEGDFIKDIYDPYTLVDGKRYGLPFDGDTHVLFYNKEILERNGFSEPPATWDEYVAQAKVITENESADGVYGAAVFGQKSPLILGASFANRLAGFGGEFVDDEGTPAINSPEAVAAAESLRDISEYALPTPAETAFGEGNAAWFNGKVGFIENWTDLGVGSQDPSTGSLVADKWGVVTLPVADESIDSRASLVAGFTWVVAGNTEKTELAKDFIKWASSSQVNEALLTALPPTGIDPNRVSSLESETYGELYPALQEVNRATLSGALAWPTGRNAGQAAQVLVDELAKYLAEDGDAKATLDRVQAKWEELLG